MCVVGVGLADGPKTPELSALMLQAQAFGRAVADANLTKNDVDGLASAGYGGMHEVQLAEYLGLTPHWLDSTSCGGSSFEFHALHAYRAIQAGDVDTVAIVYGNNELSAAGRSLGTGRSGGGGAAAVPYPMSWEFPTGLTLVGAYAMAAQRHMYQYGTTVRAARVDLGADPRARGAGTRTRCTATRSPSTTCSARSSWPTRCTSSTAASSPTAAAASSSRPRSGRRRSAGRWCTCGARPRA